MVCYEWLSSLVNTGDIDNLEMHWYLFETPLGMGFMKNLFLILMCLFSTYAKAEVLALFTNDNATLVIQGNDSDANALFDSMNVESTDNGGVLSKHISYETRYARPVFDLTCNKSQIVENASCTLKLFSPEAVINKSYKSVLMGINDRFDATAVANMFNNHTSNPYRAEVFLSIDRKLRVWKTFNSSGDVVSFTMSYN